MFKRFSKLPSTKSKEELLKYSASVAKDAEKAAEDAVFVFAGASTDDLPQGSTNLYFSGKTTDSLPEGTTYLYGDGIARTTGDVTNATSSFADATGLTFSILASKDYVFEAWVLFQSDTATTGIALGVNGPASPTSVTIQTQIPISLVAVTAGGARAYDSGTATASVDTINVNLLAKISGIIRNGSNAGTLAIRFAAETTGTVKVMTGSILRWRKTN